ncbi:phosphopantetheine-containing protein [Thioflavicoccus mobilis 8321]|uniref:Phosphopantetheine-containing protein n=1 Tax=Thioflavicoccus mobilis 8321 TaxID=765912 RepID=L0GTZ0_9GAMM|nr:phosphopantetheine-binding protein [Thioflavicoccus mobilis]AGA90228.1 phosphopantetheine-containing protein [Thioflavicoccus mobilis 8321]
MSDTLHTVIRLVEEILEEEAIEPITMETSFGEDLELESIELVMLAEKIQAEYGDKVNFAEWLSEKELDELMYMKVGDLVAYIDSCL